MTAKEIEVLVSPRSRLSSSSQRPPTRAEISLDAIGELIQRHKNNRPQRSGSQTDSDDAKIVNTEISIDSNAQLIAEIAAIVKDYQGAKGFARSGIAGEDAEDINLEDGPAGPIELISRVSNTDPDEINQLQLAQTSRPEILTDDHLESFEVFATEMLAAGRRRRNRQHYSKVKVLLINWEEDEMETNLVAKKLNSLIEDEVRKVHKLFEQDLNFSVERYAIPLVDSKGNDVNWERKVLLKVNGFVDSNDYQDTLLILYYNGHGSFQGNSCYWHPTKAASERRSGFRRPDDVQFYGPALEWNPIQNSISTTSDVLIILDCCYSGASLLDDHSKSRAPTTQILTACSKVQKTPAGPESFTMKFVQAVTDLLAIGRTKISITELYGVLVGTCTPQPFHVQRGPGNIVLERLLDPNASEQDRLLTVHNPRSRGSSFSSGLDVFSDQRTKDNAITDASSVSSNASLLVTLAFRVREDITPNAANWEHLLDAMPACESAELASVEVHVEAALPSNSTLLIVTLPLEHWLLLPPNPAYIFLGFVKGHNKLLPSNPTLKEQGRTDSNELNKLHNDEADVESQLIEAMLSFFRNISPSNPTSLKSRKPGRFQHIATKIGIIPSSHTNDGKETPRGLMSDDPHFVTISQLVQKLLVVRNENGDYEGYSYGLNFTVQRLFEETKRSVKESIRKAAGQGGGEQAVLEEKVTTEFDALEKELLEKLKEEGVRKAPTTGSGSGSSGKTMLVRKGGDDGGERTPPLDGPLTHRGSTYFNSRTSLLRHPYGGDKALRSERWEGGGSKVRKSASLKSRKTERKREKVAGGVSTPIRNILRREKTVLTKSTGRKGVRAS